MQEFIKFVGGHLDGDTWRLLKYPPSWKQLELTDPENRNRVSVYRLDLSGDEFLYVCDDAIATSGEDSADSTRARS